MIPKLDDSAVGKDVEAICSRCGETWHVIVAVADGRIAQVQCKSCNSFHKFRPIAEDRMTLKRSTRSSIAMGSKDAPHVKPVSEAERQASGGRRGGQPKAPKVSEPKILTPKVEHNGGPTKPYSIKATGFELGDKIMHAKYGAGIVDELPEPGKRFVTFETVRLLLVYGK